MFPKAEPNHYPQQYQIRKLVLGREIDSNVNGSLIVGWTAIEAAKELAKSFVSFYEGINYEISIYIIPVNVPAVAASDYQVGPVL